jgi:hypothetical protein
MTIPVSYVRGVFKSVTGADVNDIVMFLSSDPKNAWLPRKVKADTPYRIVSVDAQGWTRFMKSTSHTSIAGCEPIQNGRYVIVARNVPH